MKIKEIEKRERKIHEAKREKTQITKIRNKTGNITTYFANIKRIIKEYYE